MLQLKQCKIKNIFGQIKVLLLDLFETLKSNAVDSTDMFQLDFIKKQWCRPYWCGVTTFGSYCTKQKMSWQEPDILSEQTVIEIEK